MRPDRFPEQNTNAGGPGFGNLDKNALVLMGDHFSLIYRRWHWHFFLVNDNESVR